MSKSNYIWEKKSKWLFRGFNDSALQLIVKTKLNVVKSRNYLWKDGNDKTNIFLLLNTIYLW